MFRVPASMHPLEAAEQGHAELEWDKKQDCYQVDEEVHCQLLAQEEHLQPYGLVISVQVKQERLS